MAQRLDAVRGIGRTNAAPRCVPTTTPFNRKDVNTSHRSRTQAPRWRGAGASEGANFAAVPPWRGRRTLLTGVRLEAVTATAILMVAPSRRGSGRPAAQVCPYRGSSCVL